MNYSFNFIPSCEKEINKACKKNPILRKIINTKINEIIINPSHYKPLRYALAGERRVHIHKSFVLKFQIDEARKIVTFIAFEHHDEAYRR